MQKVKYPKFYPSEVITDNSLVGLVHHKLRKWGLEKAKNAHFFYLKKYKISHLQMFKKIERRYCLIEKNTEVLTTNDICGFL